MTNQTHESFQGLTKHILLDWGFSLIKYTMCACCICSIFLIVFVFFEFVCETAQFRTVSHIGVILCNTLYNNINGA